MGHNPGAMIARLDQSCRQQRLVQALYQAFVAERLGQETTGAGLQDARTDTFVGEGGNENDRRAVPVGNQPILQICPIHAGHVYVGDQTSRVRGAI